MSWVEPWNSSGDVVSGNGPGRHGTGTRRVTSGTPRAICRRNYVPHRLRKRTRGLWTRAEGAAVEHELRSGAHAQRVVERDIAHDAAVDEVTAVDADGRVKARGSSHMLADPREVVAALGVRSGPTSASVYGQIHRFREPLAA
jgi:hypothetical protein